MHSLHDQFLASYDGIWKAVEDELVKLQFPKVGLQHIHQVRLSMPNAGFTPRP